ncbi:MAG: hypothetical protein A2W99_05790 [Bacteroidetes bacterium GWF2_33_16]|nr:MAG: hypothetical protein A2X00_13105 [Bacteroidetes bacterium GWE2_32_14]OFY05198.1 MAG: hypothetical protein A2W99_05790 [Bacteroidetes bacterium GWF2_33_16]
MFKRIKTDILFLSIFIIFSALFYNGFEELNELPKGFHQWKQSMHFSIIQNYANGSANFLHPAMHNLFNADNTGNLILEFPVFHQIAAFIIRVFPSASPTISRWIMFILTFIGFFHAYKLANILLKNKILSVLASLLTYVIPIVVFYGGNYLVDVPAMAFGFSSIYFFEKYFIKNNFLDIVASLVFLTLSGLLRLPVLILPLSYIAASIFYRKKASYLLWFIPSIVLIFCWYYYVKKYNTYFVSYPPSETYSNLSPERITSTVKSIFDFMIFQIGWAYRSIVFYVLVAFFLLIYQKYISKFWFTVLMINLIGSILYIYLWFGIFEHHDYYIVPIVPLLFLIWVNVFFVAKNLNYMRLIIAISIIVLTLNTVNVFNNMRQRTFQKKIKATKVFAGRFESGIWRFYKDDDKIKWSVFRKISPFNNSSILLKNGIFPQDTVICDFDMSPTYSLALLDLKGWTAYNCKFDSLTSFVRYSNFGAKYLFSNIQNTSKLDSIQLSNLRKNIVFQIDNLAVYNIEHLRSK